MGAARLICIAATLLAFFGTYLATGGKGRMLRPAPQVALPGLLQLWLPKRSTRLSRADSYAALKQMPEMIDIVVLGLSAGLSFDMALESYVRHYRGELARELRGAMLSWQIGSQTREGALQQLAQRLDLVAMRNFASAVSESIELGAPLISTLERQAEYVRAEQRAQIEERIEKAPVKMLVPLGVLILPAMLLAILGPLLAAAAVFG